MEYDFSSLCADQLGKVEKRLDALKKGFIKEYEVGLNIVQHQQISETTIIIDDLMRDYINRTIALWTELLNKVKVKL